MHFNTDPCYLPEDAEFVDAARDGQLLLKQCNTCERLHFYPRPHCPHCGSVDTQWRASSGKGTIYSFTRSGQARGLKLAPAIIDLEEGIRVTSVICDADIHSLQIGDEVIVRFGSATNGAPILAFTTSMAERARAYAVRSLAASRVVKDLSPDAECTALAEAAVVGAGRMGIGIALALLSSDLHVQLVDQSEEALQQALKAIAKDFEHQVSKGRASAEEAARRLDRIRVSTDMASISRADLIIEAVWEQLSLKQQVFARIDAHAKPGAILGTNTSTLDIDLIAGAAKHPESVIGLHFFSPANVMKLLEIVRGPRTGLPALLAARELAERLRKVAVVVGVCRGFVGNRLMMARETQANQLLIEGASPQQVDRVLTQFGLPMGTFELQDMAGGIEVNYRRRQESGEENWLVDRLFELGRTGQRAGKGYYRYEPGKRTPQPDPEVSTLLEEAARLAGIERRAIPDSEVLERLVYPMINEGARLVEEGIVERASDIDVVWRYGYGWPDWNGGPMYYADHVGLPHIEKRLRELSELHGEAFEPAPLLQRIAQSGGSFTGD